MRTHETEKGLIFNSLDELFNNLEATAKLIEKNWAKYDRIKISFINGNEYVLETDKCEITCDEAYEKIYELFPIIRDWLEK